MQDGPAPGSPDEGFQSNQALDWNEQLTQELAGLRGELGT
jgi:hypothetical protein